MICLAPYTSSILASGLFLDPSLPYPYPPPSVHAAPPPPPPYWGRGGGGGGGALTNMYPPPFCSHIMTSYLLSIDPPFLPSFHCPFSPLHPSLLPSTHPLLPLSLPFPPPFPLPPSSPPPSLPFPLPLSPSPSLSPYLSHPPLPTFISLLLPPPTNLFFLLPHMYIPAALERLPRPEPVLPPLHDEVLS